MRQLIGSLVPRAGLIGVAMALVAAGPGFAEDNRAAVQDDVVLQRSAEDWVETKTVTVTLAADLAITSGGFGKARAEVEADLRGISDAAPWRLTRFNKLRDEAGYERWRILAEARLPGEVLAALGAKVKNASRPGRGFKIHGINYAPTLAERQAARAKLRAPIYQMASAEIAALNTAFSGRAFRVGTIDFAPHVVAARPLRDAPKSNRMAMLSAEAAPAAPAVAIKLIVNALVTLSAAAPETSN